MPFLFYVPFVKMSITFGCHDNVGSEDQLEASTCSIESVINEPPPSEMEEGKKPKGLPWWTVYIAWVLMVMVSNPLTLFTNLEFSGFCTFLCDLFNCTKRFIYSV